MRHTDGRTVVVPVHAGQDMPKGTLRDALDRLSAQEGVSKAVLIRRFVRAATQSLPPIEDDPLTAMIGADDFDPAPVDDVVSR